VYLEFAINALKHENWWILLAYSGMLPPMIGQLKLPSWVPDWHAMSLQPVIDIHSLRYLGAGEGLEFGDSGFDRCADYAKLHCPGLLIDVVSKVKPFPERDSEAVKEFWTDLTADHPLKIFKPGFSPLHALFNLLILGVDFSVGPDDSSIDKKKAIFAWAAYLEGILNVELPGQAQDEHMIVKIRSQWASLTMIEIQEVLRGDLLNSLPLTVMIIAGSRYHVFRTESGYIGLGPKSTMLGDKVCVLQDCPFPLLLRPSGPHYRLVGHSKVLGLTEGEAAEMHKAGKFQMEEIIIE